MANYNAIKKQTDALAQKAIAQYNEIRDAEVQNTEKIYDEQLNEINKSYEKAYDSANVQRIVNEKFAAEAAANMGLSKSGYNRNRQTQIKLAYGNAVLETDLQKASAANSIRQQLAQYKAGVESEKAQYKLSTQQAYDQQAQDSYNQQYAAEQRAAAARISAANSSAKNQARDLNDLYEKLNSADYEGKDKQKALLIRNFIEKYPECNYVKQILDFAELRQDKFLILSGYEKPENLYQGAVTIMKDLG